MMMNPWRSLGIINPAELRMPSIYAGVGYSRAIEDKVYKKGSSARGFLTPAGLATPPPSLT